MRTHVVIVNDTGWIMMKSSIPGRGIKDYTRRIEFKTELTDEEIRAVIEILKKTSPGYTEIQTKHEGRIYEFTTTFDSSD